MFRDKIRDGIARSGRVVREGGADAVGAGDGSGTGGGGTGGGGGWANSKTHSPCVGASR